MLDMIPPGLSRLLRGEGSSSPMPPAMSTRVASASCAKMEARFRASNTQIRSPRSNDGMNPNLENLIELQKLDDVIRELSAEVAGLPRRIAEIESTLSSHIKQVDTDKNALSENQKSRRRREGEIASFRDKISHLKDQSLQVKTNEQYKAMQHEVEFHEKKIREVEDQILSEMVESENLEKRVRAAEATLAEERKRASEEIAVAERRKRDDEQKLSEARTAREIPKKKIPVDIYETYERIARGRKGEAVVGVRDGTCGACHVHLRPQVFSELLTNADTDRQIRTCENCGRILYYIPPSPPTAEQEGESGRDQTTGNSSGGTAE